MTTANCSLYHTGQICLEPPSCGNVVAESPRNPCSRGAFPVVVSHKHGGVTVFCIAEDRTERARPLISINSRHGLSLNPHSCGAVRAA